VALMLALFVALRLPVSNHYILVGYTGADAYSLENNLVNRAESYSPPLTGYGIYNNSDSRGARREP
jgi:hypothetical protein